MAFAANEEKMFEKTKLKAAFDAFDWSNTGYITEDDLIHFAASAGGASAFRGEKVLKKRTICEMIELADRNGDGKISFEEFADMMLKTNIHSAEEARTNKLKFKKEKNAKKEYYAKLLNKKR